MPTRKFKLFALEIPYQKSDGARSASSDQKSETLKNEFEIFSELEVKQSYRLHQGRDSSAQSIPLEINSEDRIELVFDDNTIWFGDLNTFDEVFPITQKNRGAKDDVNEFPSVLEADDSNRSIIGAVVVKVLTVFAKKAIKKAVDKAVDKVANFSVLQLAKKYEQKSIGKSGLFSLDASMKMTDFTNQSVKGSYFLFIHGTASSTTGSFDKILDSEPWRYIQSYFNGKVLGFQHATLTESPLSNLLDLVKALPNEAEITLVTHSRGGIVGDLLAKFTHDNIGFTDDQLDYLKRMNYPIEPISLIRQTLSKKKIKVVKYIRVACPAYGTTLMSQRIDTICNVLMNLIPNEFIQDFCKAVINEVLEDRVDVKVLPGLESMNPNSSLLNVLNTELPFEQKLDSPLAIIAGNSGLSISLKGLAVMLMRYVFDSDNDFVVNTLSMYQGVQRKMRPIYFLDESGEASHFNYFKNKKTQQAILSVLKVNQFDAVRAVKSVGDKIEVNSYRVPSFNEYIPESEFTSGRGLIGLEFGKLFYNNVSGTKPILILLPGIMGSNLEIEKDNVWLNYLRMVDGQLIKLDIHANHEVKATSIIKTSYKKLADFLSKKYDVYTFAFDWRKSVTEAGDQLRDIVKGFLKLNQPIQFVAHSMGGLVVRQLMLREKALWNTILEKSNCAFLMLGTPWLGSYRIPAVLSGNDGIINKVSKLDLKHRKDDLINMFSKFPGLLNLLPIHDKAYDFTSEEVWERLQHSSGLTWQIPDEKTLKQFANFKDEVVNGIQGMSFNKVVYIAGKDDRTPSGYSISENGIEIEYDQFGDQSVMWDTGIPRGMNHATSVYYVNETHGGLSCAETMFEGILEILNLGSTTRFDRTPDKIVNNQRGLPRLHEEELFEITEESVSRAIMGVKTKRRVIKTQYPALRISVSNGNLQFSKYPVLIGHFFKDGIVNAEKAADWLLDYSLSKKHSLGVYPGGIGTNEIAITKTSSWNNFNGTIIVGLGQQESLTINNLAITIEKAIVRYLIDINTSNSIPDGPIGISSLLIGSFYGGLSLVNSVIAIIQGISQANEKVYGVFEGAKIIEHLELVELYEDRALQCYSTVQGLIGKVNEGLTIEWDNKEMNVINGFRKRIISESVADWWHRLSISVPEIDEKKKKDSIRKMIYYSTTATSREEIQDLYTNVDMLESCLHAITEDDKWTSVQAKTIFELLIPNDFKQNFYSQHNIVWVLDKIAASYPWELMQVSIESGVKPISICAKMIRQLATYDYNKSVNNSKSSRVLIVGDPNLEGFKGAPQLPGARNEANLVYKKFSSHPSFEVSDFLIGDSSNNILNAIFKTDYRVMHLAGHGIFDAKNPMNTGMIIGKVLKITIDECTLEKKEDETPILLTPNEITKITELPELVFLNCCYLGTVNGEAEKNSRDKYKLAANLGTELIDRGVKAVVVAGWAVNDNSATVFADEFYKQMLEAADFGTAVFEARKRVYAENTGNNTWGAYQCYGDPFYKLVDKNAESKSKDDTTPYNNVLELEYDLENLIQDMEIPTMELSYLERRLRVILSKRDVSSFVSKNSSAVHEKIGKAYLELNQFEKAIEYLTMLTRENKAEYQMQAIEQLYNSICKYQFSRKRLVYKEYKSALKEIEESIRKMDSLISLSKTSERYSIRASAYKRKAAIIAQGLFNDILTKEYSQEDVQFAIHQALLDYKIAYSISTKNKMYPYCNWKEIEAIMEMFDYFERESSYQLTDDSEVYFVEGKKSILTELEKEIVEKENKHLEYWDRIDFANATLCKFLVNRGDDVDKIISAYNKCWNYNGSMNKKVAELEHFDTLIYLCNYFKNARTDRVASALNNIKNQLQDNLIGKVIESDELNEGSPTGQTKEVKKPVAKSKTVVKKTPKKNSKPNSSTEGKK